MIRDERDGDAPGVREVHEQAFETAAEAGLVEVLRRGCSDRISLVAEEGCRIDGHILFTPVDIGDVPVRGYGLAPMAVRPERQRHGLGSSLVRAGLERVRQTGAPFVFVIGHPAFYPRFGFTRASAYGVRAVWEGIPDEAVMLLMIDPAAASRLGGLARYRPEFDAV